MGLFKVIGGVVKGTAAVVGGVAKGTALVAEGVVKGTAAVAEGISGTLAEDEKKGGKNNSTTTTYSEEAFVVEEGTTILDSESFENYNDEEIIILPSTLEKIQNDAFETCENVKNIDFSKVYKVKTLPTSLFKELNSLKGIIIPEGVIEIEPDSINNCKRLEEVILPSTIEKIGKQFSGCKGLRKIDTSKVCRLKKIPEDFVEDKNVIIEFVIPQGVETVGSHFLDVGHHVRVYVPSSVREISFISGNEDNENTVFLYSDKINNIEEFCSDVSTLYVTPKAYEHYKKMIDDIEAEVKLVSMPSFMVNAYKDRFTAKKETNVSPNASLSNTQPAVKSHTAPATTEMPKENNSTPTYTSSAQTIQKSPGNLFSDGLEELINSVAESDEITDKKKEIILRRAVKEGEDPDEVEMVLEARFYEAHNK